MYSFAIHDSRSSLGVGGIFNPAGWLGVQFLMDIHSSTARSSTRSIVSGGRGMCFPNQSQYALSRSDE